MRHRQRLQVIPLEEKIDFVMRVFGFDKVRQVMEHLHWTWHFDSQPRTPTVDELRECAMRHILAVTSRPLSSKGFNYQKSGGFKAFWDGDLLELTFELHDAWYCNQRVD